MLSKPECHDFVTNILGILNCFEKFKQDKRQLVCNILHTFMHIEPFQTVHAINVSPGNRRLPLFKEIEDAMFKCQGGSCYSLNYFVRELLVTIGYDVRFVGCNAFGQRNFHLALIIRSLDEPGDIYLVDVGTSLPTWKIIPIDFKTVSPVYTQGFLHYQLKRKDDTTIEVFHKRNKPSELNTGQTNWYLYYEVCLTSVDIEDFAVNMEQLYVNPNYSSFPFLLEVRVVIFKNDRLFALKNKEFIYENDQKELMKELVMTTSELRHILLKYFPKIYSFNNNILELIENPM
ncbi:uncharacterized protein LOC117124102 [Anneissia japonica]|uniref:uncharacterized protein LOC117124102 n=1 Tax=Anneissia japonica TaxID=1529436 RepID=UPI0014256333|nr:uncharacterized protein LOC117124102 [Anneissia japonica]